MRNPSSSLYATKSTTKWYEISLDVNCSVYILDDKRGEREKRERESELNLRIGRKILLRVFFSLMQTLLSVLVMLTYLLKTKKDSRRTTNVLSTKKNRQIKGESEVWARKDNDDDDDDEKSFFEKMKFIGFETLIGTIFSHIRKR